MSSTHPAPSLTLGKALATGGIGFTVVSLAAFSPWAFAGRWFYRHVGEAGLYAVCAVVFLLLSGLLMSPLIAGERKLLRFYRAFVPAFVAYAVVWSACWFAWRGKGEWAGSLLGCAAFGLCVAAALGNMRRVALTIVLLFVLHSAGYFAGGYAMAQLKGNLAGKLAWGLFYGMGFGLGIGLTFFIPQNRSAALLTSTPRASSGETRGDAHVTRTVPK